MEKRIYSLNLIAFVQFRTRVRPQLGRDDNGVFYAVFPESQGVGRAIREWKQIGCTVEIHQFLNVYGELRARIKEIREGVQECQEQGKM